jgi:hypothetical protein
MDPKMGGIINAILLQSKDKLKVRGYWILCYWVEPNIGIELSKIFLFHKTNYSQYSNNAFFCRSNFTAVPRQNIYL